MKAALYFVSGILIWMLFLLAAFGLWEPVASSASAQELMAMECLAGLWLVASVAMLAQIPAQARTAWLFALFLFFDVSIFAMLVTEGGEPFRDNLGPALLFLGACAMGMTGGMILTCYGFGGFKSLRDLYAH